MCHDFKPSTLAGPLHRNVLRRRGEYHVFFDVLEAIVLSPGRLIALSYGTYCQHARHLEPTKKLGWFTVMESISLAAGNALGLCALPKPALAERLRVWFLQGKAADGSCQGTGVYVAIEPTVLLVGLQVALTAEKATAWQFYVKAVAASTFAVRRQLPFSSGECIQCSALQPMCIRLNKRPRCLNLLNRLFLSKVRLKSCFTTPPNY